ncbi:MAG: 3-dehydroquinate synthase [Bacillaceae bacterium]|nr:3-dehydroquinate synthase [Bacillaceae bacterium]
MKTITVGTASHSYPVYLGERLRWNVQSLLPKDYQKILIVTDSHVSDYYLKDVKSSLKEGQKVYSYVIPAGEQSKNLRQFENIHTFAIKKGLDRNSLIIALGGGVVGDLAGFVAATYMRGIDYIQMPTTILAHDSSVGGKVAINHQLGKNMIGHFYQPKAVIYDLDTLASLPIKEVRSGFAEIIKHAFIADRELLFTLFEQMTSMENMDWKLLEHALIRGIEIKSAIVNQDERDFGVRHYLNFGHTLGHALEAESGYGTLTHGEAVALGMWFALKVSQEVFSNPLPIQEYENWLKQMGYPMMISHVEPGRLIELMKTDKKSANDEIRMVLLRDLENPEVVPMQEDRLGTLLDNFFNGVIQK